MANKLTKIVADFSTSLATKAAVGATTATLQSATDDDGVALPAGQYCFTIDGNSSVKEYWLCTLSGTSLSSIQNVTRQGTLSSGSVREHRIGASVKLTNFAELLFLKNLLDGTDTLTSTNIMKYDANPSFTPGSFELATVKYADDLAIAGAPDASATSKGIVEIATQAEVNAGDDTGSTTAPVVVIPSTLANVVQDASYVYAADAEASDTYVITLTPAPAALAAGQSFYFKANTANTGGATLNVNGLGAKNILKYRDQALETGDIEAGKIVHVIYDGTSMQLQSPVDSSLSTANTALVATNIATLTDGSDADALHYHPDAVKGFSGSFSGSTGTFAAGADQTQSGGRTVSYYDAATPEIGMMGFLTSSDGLVARLYGKYQIASDYGYQPCYVGTEAYAGTGGLSGTISGAIRDVANSHVWTSYENNTLGYDSGAGTFASGTEHGPLSFDATNTYLLMLTSTTNIRRFSINAAQLTQVDNITLDTAVTETGFLFDDTNNQYVCIDKSNNLLRRFDSSGTTVDTVAYTIDDTSVIGVVIINNRVHLVTANSVGLTVANASVFTKTVHWDFIPTNMTR